MKLSGKDNRGEVDKVDICLLFIVLALLFASFYIFISLQDPVASTTFKQSYDEDGQVIDESALSTEKNVAGGVEWKYNSERDKLIRNKLVRTSYDNCSSCIKGITSEFQWNETAGHYLNGDGDSAQSEGAFSDVNDFRIQTGEYKATIKLTSADNIDYVLVDSAPDYVEFSSTDVDSPDGFDTWKTTMDTDGDVITVENVAEGDQFRVVAVKGENIKFLHRYEINQSQWSATHD